MPCGRPPAPSRCWHPAPPGHGGGRPIRHPRRPRAPHQPRAPRPRGRAARALRGPAPAPRRPRARWWPGSAPRQARTCTSTRAGGAPPPPPAHQQAAARRTRACRRGARPRAPQSACSACGAADGGAHLVHALRQDLRQRALLAAQPRPGRARQPAAGPRLRARVHEAQHEAGAVQRAQPHPLRRGEREQRRLALAQLDKVRLERLRAEPLGRHGPCGCSHCCAGAGAFPRAREPGRTWGGCADAVSVFSRRRASASHHGAMMCSAAHNHLSG